MKYILFLHLLLVSTVSFSQHVDNSACNDIEFDITHIIKKPLYDIRTDLNTYNICNIKDKYYIKEIETIPCVKKLKVDYVIYHNKVIFNLYDYNNINVNNYNYILKTKNSNLSINNIFKKDTTHIYIIFSDNKSILKNEYLLNIYYKKKLIKVFDITHN